MSRGLFAKMVKSLKFHFPVSVGCYGYSSANEG
jgi:hypothetical protein